ncbi:MAG: type VI secretion system-associated FHA domain protein TagH [Steroidobacteraceae bacterium]|nr:type VI secretion system-associated FHA domain protein TagH [Steroidobacteraceae bacterium]MDW8259046.1 type VI secretion system-associated FHA domain protein TagH [Gammaproteobacteria bacterium]
MALRLRVVSNHRRSLGQRATVVFGVTGGSIGRAADNDWVLPDPLRYVSSRHARVRFQAGKYYLEDLSTNGTYINDSDTPIPKGTACQLHNGDVIRLGEYHIVVSLDHSADTGGVKTAMVDLGLEGDSAFERSTSMSGNSDLGISNSDLFRTGDSGSRSGLRAVNAYGQAVVVPMTKAKGVTPSAAQPVEDSDIVAARRMERLARAVRESQASLAQTQDARAGLEAFCRGAGLDPASLPAEGAAGMLQVAGRLLREALIGLKDLDTKQTETRSQFRIRVERDASQEHFRIGAATDELLGALLTSYDSRRLDAAQWLRHCFEDCARHQEGLVRGARAGFSEFLRQLDPHELEKRFETGVRRGLLAAKPNKWELYGEFYKTACEPEPHSGVPTLFVESFAAAYLAATPKT